MGLAGLFLAIVGLFLFAVEVLRAMGEGWSATASEEGKVGPS